MKQIAGYAWKDKKTESFYHATAEQAHDAFEIIRKREGKLTPEAVVEDARPEDSVLHEDFEWRDDVAAERYREGQARKMIGSVRILRVDSRPPVRAYVNVRVIEQKPLKFEDVVRKPEPEADDAQAQEGVRCYMPMQEVLQKPALYDQMMADARRDAQTYRQKYSTLEELAPIMEAIQTTFETEV
jgi:predicted SPOUT superfamily RNA methylase MTH1